MKKRKTNIEMERKKLKRIADNGGSGIGVGGGSCQKNRGKLVIPARDEVEGKDRGVLSRGIIIIMIYNTLAIHNGEVSIPANIKEGKHSSTRRKAH